MQRSFGCLLRKAVEDERSKREKDERRLSRGRDVAAARVPRAASPAVERRETKPLPGRMKTATRLRTAGAASSPCPLPATCFPFDTHSPARPAGLSPDRPFADAGRAIAGRSAAGTASTRLPGCLVPVFHRPGPGPPLSGKMGAAYPPHEHAPFLSPGHRLTGQAPAIHGRRLVILPLPRRQGADGPLEGLLSAPPRSEFFPGGKRGLLNGVGGLPAWSGAPAWWLT